MDCNLEDYKPEECSSVDKKADNRSLVVYKLGGYNLECKSVDYSLELDNKLGDCSLELDNKSGGYNLVDKLEERSTPVDKMVDKSVGYSLELGNK
jgi:hypothetical protein